VPLKIGGNELEILRGKFVCFARNNGETSYFSEWRELDRELRDEFEAIREQLLEVMENFMNSKHNTTFEAISEVYKKKDPPDCVKKPESGIST
jgi:hypothetical protein